MQESRQVFHQGSDYKEPAKCQVFVKTATIATKILNYLFHDAIRTVKKVQCPVTFTLDKLISLKFRYIASS